jgi:hypothetical protein
MCKRRLVNDRQNERLRLPAPGKSVFPSQFPVAFAAVSSLLPANNCASKSARPSMSPIA